MYAILLVNKKKEMISHITMYWVHADLKHLITTGHVSLRHRNDFIIYLKYTVNNIYLIYLYI